MVVSPLNQDAAPEHMLELLLETTLKRHFGAAARVAGFRERSREETGYSGALVRVYDVDVIDGCSLYDIPLVVKDVHPVERQVMAFLDDKAYPNVPFSFGFDDTTTERALLCQQYIEANSDPWAEPTVRQAALALARIHVDALGCARQHDWLPHADHAYFSGDFIVSGWREAWTRALSDPDFAGTYGAFTGDMEQAAATLLTAMDQLWDEGDTLTLVHGDLHDGNIRVQDGYPYFIDWEMAHYGTFYIDLPNYFSPRTSLLYRDALASLGHEVPLDTFKQRYADTTRMLGFRYMPYWIDHWHRDAARRENSQHSISSLITTAITGVPTP